MATKPAVSVSASPWRMLDEKMTRSMGSGVVKI
jgi:hypothetical protein